MKVATELVLSYLKNKVLVYLQEAGLSILEKFKSSIWEEVKKEVKVVARKAIDDVDNYCNSLYATEREEAIINKVMEQIKLPLLLRPFKGLIKNMLKHKIEELVSNAINKGREFIA